MMEEMDVKAEYGRILTSHRRMDDMMAMAEEWWRAAVLKRGSTKTSIMQS
jgi:hypothetical protein